DRRFFGAGLERGLYSFAFVVIHPAIDQRQALATEPVTSEDLVHPLLRRSVFGEKYDPLVRPLAIDLEVLGEPFQYGASLGVLFT
ncbi:hypothetical protein, partial [Escherichia coli]|uniref:hypothetical protein n=1 Tax=Escherichia coli TaxID=562 RepID=UPI0013D8CB70